MSSKMYHQFACSSMLLPEHRELLNRLQRESRRQEEIRLPDFDQQQQEEWQQLLDALAGKQAAAGHLFKRNWLHHPEGPAYAPVPSSRLRLKTEQGR